MYSQLSMAVDVFSLGVVLLELLLGQPIHGRMYPTLTYAWGFLNVCFLSISTHWTSTPLYPHAGRMTLALQRS